MSFIYYVFLASAFILNALFSCLNTPYKDEKLFTLLETLNSFHPLSFACVLQFFLPSNRLFSYHFISKTDLLRIQNISQTKKLTLEIFILFIRNSSVVLLRTKKFKSNALLNSPKIRDKKINIDFQIYNL